MSQSVISVENLSKYYKLGVIGGATLREDMSRWLAKLQGKPDPALPIGSEQDTMRKRGEIWALRDINFEVKEGEILGIIGRNGAGKSTLLKILSRITAPTAGRAVIRGRVGSLLEVGTGFHPELTGRENIYLNGAILGMSKAEVSRKLEEIVSFAEMTKFLDTPVKRYSSGMIVRLAFAVAAHLEPEILIVDEVLAVGDAVFQQKCLGKMDEVASAGRTILFVSHNLDSVRRLCTRGLVLSSGGVVAAGTASEATDYYLGLDEKEGSGGAIEFPASGDESYDIIRIELLDPQGNRLDQVRTWDSVTFRIVFHSPEPVRGGSVVLQIASMSGTVLHLCSTQPDNNHIVNFRAGVNQIDCHFPKLMLSAGRYRIGAALALPHVRWLVSKLEGGLLLVESRDVYQSGLAPHNSRYAVPCEYTWENVPDAEPIGAKPPTAV